VLLGGSGSGKSTILRMIAGLLTPDAGGRIEINGQRRDVPADPRQRGARLCLPELLHLPAHDRRTEHRLRPEASVETCSQSERRKRRTSELLDLIGLGGLGDTLLRPALGRTTASASRVARALAYEPGVLLLDEPFSALDVKIRAQLRQSLKADPAPVESYHHPGHPRSGGGLRAGRPHRRGGQWAGDRGRDTAQVVSLSTI
jgi:ABC-type sulfate/molybdate transport systems ATPase subunit